MKKIIVICMVLLAISSCKKGNDYVPLSEEDAAAIPYQMGQTVKFITNDNNTVVCQVTWDQTHLSDYNTDHNYGSETLDFGSPGVYCYTRTVELTCETYAIYPHRTKPFRLMASLMNTCITSGSTTNSAEKCSTTGIITKNMVCCISKKAISRLQECCQTTRTTPATQSNSSGIGMCNPITCGFTTSPTRIHGLTMDHTHMKKHGTCLTLIMLATTPSSSMPMEPCVGT